MKAQLRFWLLEKSDYKDIKYGREETRMAMPEQWTSYAKNGDNSAGQSLG